MPPWHIDRSVGVQKFKNDMSLTDEQVETIVNWVDSGAPQGNPPTCRRPSRSRRRSTGRRERDGYGPPDIVVKSGEQTMPALHQDEWWRPLVDIPGLTEPRWVRMVEIRPSNIQGRKILHHSIAYQVLEPRERRRGEQRHRTRRPGRRQRRGSGCRRSRQPPAAADGMGHRQGLRPLHGRHRQGDHAGREDLVGPAHSRRGRGDHGRIRAGHLALSERPGAEEAQLPDWLHRPQERPRRARHPAEPGRAHGRLHGAAGEHDHHQLPAALSPARQGHAGRGDSADAAARRSSATCRTSTSTG